MNSNIIAEKNTTNRIEAFSDGVLAIVITLMVLEIKLPEIHHQASNSETWRLLMPVFPKLLSYLLSFVMVAIYWINHHQFFDSLGKADNTLLWLNCNFLFWICLLPFPTEFLGTHPHSQVAAFLFALLMLMCALSFFLMRWYALSKAKIFHAHVTEEYIKSSLRKSISAPFLYAVAMLIAFFNVYLTYIIFVLVPLLFFIPQKHSKK